MCFCVRTSAAFDSDGGPPLEALASPSRSPDSAKRDGLVERERVRERPGNINFAHSLHPTF